MYYVDPHNIWTSPRWNLDGRVQVIVQCKHWQKSGLDALMSHLKKKELPKIKLLNPRRYILATTVSVSRLNKKAISTDLAPFLVSEADLIGQEDLEDLIDRNPDVELRHYKLWLSSTNVLISIFNNAVIGRSKDRLEEIVEFSRRYVFTKNHELAFEKLQKHHVVIITGEAGLGKTTIGEQLCLQLIEKEFQFIFIDERIEEAESAYVEDRKQIFFFDDFLGRNYLEALARNEDSKIVQFIRRVSRDSMKRFVLTSRTTILNQGKSLSDQFHIGNIERTEFEVKLTVLNDYDRARILYNHLWFSSLSSDFVDEFYSDRRYRIVIRHKNFNPRVISFLTDPYKIREVNIADYWGYVKKSLDLPVEIWSNVFQNQLDKFGRSVVSLVVYNGRTIQEDALASAYRTYITETLGGVLPAAIPDFDRLSRVLVGAVLNRVHETSKSSVRFELFNPSVADYVLYLLKKSGEDIGPYFEALATKESLDTLENLFKTNIITLDAYHGILVRLLARTRASDAKVVGYSFRLIRKLIELGFDYFSFSESALTMISSVNWGYLTQIEYSDLLDVLGWYVEESTEEGLHSRVESLFEELLEESLSHENLVRIARITTKLQTETSETVVAKVKSTAVKYWSYNLEDEVVSCGTLDGISEEMPNPIDRATGKVDDLLNDRLSEFPFEFEDDVFAEIASNCDVDHLVDSVLRHNHDYIDDDYDRYVDARGIRESEEHAIDDLFDRG